MRACEYSIYQNFRMGKHTNGLWQGKSCVTMNVCHFQRAHPKKSIWKEIMHIRVGGAVRKADRDPGKDRKRTMAKDGKEFKGKGFIAEFRKFITRGNVPDMAVGVRCPHCTSHLEENHAA